VAETTRAFGAMARRTWAKVLHRPVVLVFSLAQPLMWMVFFGFLFQRYSVGDSGAAYRDYLLPGICAMTVLFGASQCGVALIRDVQSGFLARMLATPAPVAALMAGKVAADVARLMAQAAVVAAVGALVGAHLHPRLLPLASSLILAVAFAWAYASFSCWLALKTRSQEVMGVFIQAANMPILFTSTALVPSRHMPAWLSACARANPLSTVADGLRAGASGLGTGPGTWALVIMALAAGLAFAAAVREMAKSRLR
jgi:ABC-2 type transport system permease protein